MTPSRFQLLADTRCNERTPRISVVFATHNRARLLARLLDGLSNQTMPLDEFEVVVVDDGSTDETPDVLRSQAGSSKLQIYALRKPVAEGPATARNIAWRSARADLIAFTDDDCVPAPGWLEGGLRVLHHEPGVVVGRTLPERSFPERGPFSRTMHVEDVGYFAGCNVFYWRTDLEAVGGFDEEYVLPIGEDTDLAWRVLERLDRPSAFARDALVYHEIRENSIFGAINETRRLRSIPLFIKAHPIARQTVLHRRLFWHAAHPKVILGTAGVALSAWHPVGLALLAPWVLHRLVRKPLPGRIRYRPLALLGAFAVDLSEVLVLAKWSIRYRCVVL